MRKFLSTTGGRVSALLAVMSLFAGAGLGAASLASAAPENPAMVGKRVLCVNSLGDFKALDAPCSGHVDRTASDGRSLWYAGPLPVPGAAGYAESIRAIVGTSTAPDPAALAALVKAEVAKQVAAGGGASAKHAVVTFGADWATTPEIKQLTKCPILKLTGISSTINGQFLDETTVAYGPEKKASATPSAPFGRYCFAVLSDKLPKYSAGQPEQWGSTVSDTTMASESDVTVLGEVAPANGATTRTFVVSINAALTDPTAPGTIAAFSNSRQFTVDFSTLVF